MQVSGFRRSDAQGHQEIIVAYLRLLVHFGWATEDTVTAAGRAMGMSYRRAWDLVEEIQTIFGKPVTSRHAGGKHGGGATLTPFGARLIARFRAIERAAYDAARLDIEALQNEVEIPAGSDLS